MTMTTSKARPQQTDRETMERLHRALTEHFLHYVTNVPREKWTVGMVAQMRRFLADNGVSAEQGRKAMDKGWLSTLLDLQVPFGNAGDH